MRNAAAALLLVSTVAGMVGVAGCGQTDPCAGHSGVCVGLRVEGHVANLDILDVALVFGGNSEHQATSPRAISLPAVVALDLPAGTSGAIGITVFGEAADKTLLASGATSVQLSGSHAQATVTLTSTSGTSDLAGFPNVGDLSGGQGSGDMAGCGLVTACVNGDSCCPSGCNNSSDSDCPSICGNGVTEAGEVCDDNNTKSGDGCDATCTWSEKLSSFSGRPSGFGHADDPNFVNARVDTPTGVAMDVSTNTVYFSDSTDCTIRTATGDMTMPAISTFMGAPWDCQEKDGDVTTARFNQPSDMELINGVLYVVDKYSFHFLRAINIATKKVTTIAFPDSGGTVNGIGQFKNKLVMYENEPFTGTSALFIYDPMTNGYSSLYSAQLPSNVAGPGACQDIACDVGTYCYLTCNANVVRFTMTSSPITAASYAGLYSNSSFENTCAGYTTMPLSSTPFWGAASIFVDPFGGNVIVSDTTCSSLVSLAAMGGVTLAGGMDNVGGTIYDQVSGMQATLNGPSGAAAVGNNNYVVADPGDHLLRMVSDLAPYYTHLISGVLPAGFESTFGSTAVTTPDYFSRHTGIATDGTNVYAITSNGRILKVALANGAATLLVDPSNEPLTTSSYLDLVRIGTTLYAATSTGQIISVGVDGTGAKIYANTSGDAGPTDGPAASAGMRPTRLATDGTSLFFIDAGTEVRKIDAAGMVTTLAGVSGSGDATDGTGTGAHFEAAAAIATDGNYVYVSDTNAPGLPSVTPPPTAIRRVAIATGKVETIAGSLTDVGHVDGAAADARFASIYSLATDGRSLFIGDVNGEDAATGSLAPTIRQLVLATMTVGTSVGQAGQGTFVAGSGIAARVHDPRTLTFDATTHALVFYDNAEYLFARIK